MLWSSSQEDYTEKLVNLIDPLRLTNEKKRFFSHYLDLSHCQRSEDDSFYIKNIDVLLENRIKDDIVLVDTNMHNFTTNLTNGIYLPPYSLDKDK